MCEYVLYHFSFETGFFSITAALMRELPPVHSGQKPKVPGYMMPGQLSHIIYKHLIAAFSKTRVFLLFYSVFSFLLWHMYAWQFFL